MTKVTHLTLDESGGLSRKRIHLREISGEADTPLETVGQDLRTARLRRGDDLATASKALKIRKDHLEALEEDRLDSLPGRTYAIGFVRSYAEYLGLDPVDAAERFKSEIAGRDETPRKEVFTDGGEERHLPHGWVVVAIVVLGLVFYGAYRLASSADSLLDEPVAPVPARMAAPDTQTPPSKPVITSPQPASAPQPATAGASASPAQFKSEISGQTNSAAAEKALSPAKQAQAAPAQTTSTPPQPAGQVYGQRNIGSRVYLRALKPIRVLVEGSDGVIYINRTLHTDDTYRVPDRVGLTLSTPDAGSLEVELDGQVMGRAGRQGQFTEALSLDPQAIVDRYNGR